MKAKRYPILLLLLSIAAIFLLPLLANAGDTAPEWRNKKEEALYKRRLEREARTERRRIEKEKAEKRRDENRRRIEARSQKRRAREASSLKARFTDKDQSFTGIDSVYLGRVRFPHTTHKDDLDCKSCHHYPADGRKCFECHLRDADNDLGAGRIARRIILNEKGKNIFHTQCLWCHKQRKKGPAECKDCHGTNKMSEIRR